MNKIYRKLLRIKKNLSINLFLFYHLFFEKSNSRNVKFRGYKIFVQDFLSFYYEVVYIFRDKIYDFNSIKKNPFIIDGGACIGTSILYFKKKYPASKIIAFEPSVDVFEILSKNINNNKLENIELLNYGLYNVNSELSFSKNSIDSGKVDVAGSEKVRVIKLSDYINEEVDFLKLNIEGAEFEVLKELDESGKIKKINQMCFEWHSFSGQAQNLDEILSILKNNNFKYYLSSLSTVNFGEFKAEKDTEYFMMIYAKQIN